MFSEVFRASASYHKEQTMRTFMTMVVSTSMAFALMVLPTQPAWAQSFTVLHNFTGGQDGGFVYAGLTIDKAGNMYGTTYQGGYTGGDCAGYGGCGTVFRLSRKGSGWIFSPLYSFLWGSDGAAPLAGVTVGPDGALYGTTNWGGGSNQCTNGCGTVFSLRPQAHSCASVSCPWSESVLYRFTGADGAFPQYGDLIFDQSGSLYGTTRQGGIWGLLCGDGGGTCGIVYKLTPAGAGWTESILYAFTGESDGYYPYSGMIFDNTGKIMYGTTLFGGAYGIMSGYGTVYQLILTGNGWTENTLYTFQNGSDGEWPYAGITLDQSGRVYGSASYGGIGNGGTVFQLTPSGGSWLFSLLYSFSGTCGPRGNLVFDPNGNLYGTTVCDGANKLGNVFKLTPGIGGWTYTSLHDFSGSDGAGPYGSLLLDADGNLHGTTARGGTYNEGVVWEITP
jgi:uncharacterized repeat protein (TIGR03803 family)